MSTPMMILPSLWLRRALWLDVAASAAVALLQLAGGARLAAATGLPAALLLETALFMLAWGLALLWLAGGRSGRPVPAWCVRVVIAGNLAWAVAALATGLGLAVPPAGWALIAVHGAGVLLFAALQWAGLARSVPQSAAGLVLQPR
ncbi:MAG: hypothetical protein KBC73_24645 [Burkholderiaceae bacterium]|nr:hypothetical protein [Burkholderiaceae bacterium]